ncbi:alpha-glycosidase [Paenibacillus sp. 481]|uniref:alpha-glycosidase n=1 Tax=Paenibacillus sp. 481 TaxID=2835869 RepID=UPI001E2EB823|nr:alpha-glycosidase [Paenibacillus sp. 481]UHA74964.1 alpha-glycosidase [Paenibacillus sp. 481]
MQLEAIYHRSKQNGSYAYDRETVHIRIRTKKDDVTAVDVIAVDKYAFQRTTVSVPMRKFTSDALFDYWEAAYKPPYRRLRYAFRLEDAQEQWYLTERGFRKELPEHYFESFEFPYLNGVDVFEPPTWVKEAVFYQIFPERFANGDKQNDPPNVQPWGGEPKPDNFFGGDLEGVIQHLDHLSELGITAIYFTPVFEATTNHKYDTRDYKKVDPHFGSNEKLKELVAACHARGIRVLLDAVFNHAGRTFPPFVDVLEHGEQSAYKDWFYVHDYPLRVEDGIPTYETFAFEPIMPKLNTEHPEVKQYLLDAARYWIEEVGIDGWRLDVANEVDHQFWREFRQVVKQANPEAYILGEIWHDSMAWLQGDQFDAVMNYPLTDAMLDFFAKETVDAAEFSSLVGTQLAYYPQQATEVAFNLLDSHDTPRLLTQCGGDKRRMKLATLFQFTHPGVPCVYYGNEIGIEGEGDPDCRRCMEWDEEKQDRELFNFYRDVIALRRKHAALRSVGIRFLQAEAGSRVLMYERWSESGERFLIALNAAAKSTVLRTELPLDGKAWRTELASDASIASVGDALTIQLEAYGFAVMKQVADQ